MPDISKYSQDTPFVPHSFSQVNLGNAFIPSVTTPGTTTPSGSGPGNDTWKFFMQGASNPFAGRGIVPSGPGAVGDFNQKFSSETTGFTGDNSLKDIGYLIGRDNENLWAKNRNWFDETFSTAMRIIDKTGAYSMQGIGYLGGLIGIGNKNTNYHSGSNFADWIAGAADNGLAKWGSDLAEDVDSIYRPLYNEASDRDAGFFKRMFTDTEFWKGDVADGAAFMLSAYATAGIIGDLKLGETAMRGINTWRGLQFADEAAALSTEGLSGMSEAANLSKAATATADGAPVVHNILAKDAGTIITEAAKEAGNFANASKINMGVATLINTASESMSEASSLKNELVDKLMSEKNNDGTAKYTPEQARDISARAARNSFLLNMLVLGPSNLWEIKTFFGAKNALSTRNAANKLIRHEGGLLADAEIVKRTFGQKGLSYLKNVGEGVVAEGLWEENIQLAIERMNQDPENIDANFLVNIGRTLNQFAKQSVAALSGNDPEAAMNIGIGGLIGGGMGAKVHIKDMSSLKREVTNYNNAISTFRTTAKDLYEKNDDGSIKLDANGNPSINANNVISYVSTLNKTLNMTELADNLKGKNMDLLHSIVDNENIARLVKSYADNGMIDALISKLDNAKGFKKEDLLMLGLSDNVEKNNQRIDAIKKKVLQQKSIYDNIQKNFLVNVKNDDKRKTKAELMKQSLYFLSTRAAHLAELKDTVDNKAIQTGTELAARYVAPTDGMVDRLNDLHNEYLAAKKRVDYLSTQGYYQLSSGMRTIEDSNFETIDLGNGNTITTPKTKNVAHPQEVNAVDEDVLNEAVQNLNKAEAALKQHIIDNKDEVKNIKKNADGSFRYEISERNRLMYETDTVKNQRIAKDIDMARNATLNVFNRISDIKFGEKYWDTVYGQRKIDLQEQVVNDDSDQVDGNLTDEPPTPPTSGPDDTITPEQAEKIKKETKDFSDLYDEERDLEQEKEFMTSQEEVLSPEQESRLNEIDERLDTINKVRQQRDEENRNEQVVDDAVNIKPEDKEQYTEILNKIAENKKRVKKFNTHYEVDGKYFRKVSEIIGDNVTIDPAAANKGYTVDSIVKAFFANELNDNFKKDLASKISEDALNDMIKQLQAIKTKLEAQGINIVANNVIVFDEGLGVAGEIDLLGVDKNGNFKVYEITARRPEVYRIYGKSEKGISIRALDSKRLSAYRNLFANQYEAIPDEISVMFPFAVSYDKESPDGFIEKVKLKDKIRFVPERNVEIKMKAFKPIRSGSKFDNFDLFTLFSKTYVPAALTSVREKLNFLFRNESFDAIKKNLTLKIGNLKGEFLTNYQSQQDALNGKGSTAFTGNLKVDNVIAYTDPEINKYKPNEQLKFNQGTKYEAVRIVSSPDMIELISMGSKISKRLTGKTTTTINENRKTQLEKQLGISAIAAYDKARELAKENRNENVENIIVISNETKSNYKINKAAYTNSFGNRIEFDNLYALRNSKSMSLHYGDELVGFLSPIPALAYKDATGNFQVLSPATDAKTYSEVTGNSAQTHSEFQKLSKAYLNSYKGLIAKLEESGTDEITLNNKELNDLFDVTMSYGELDKIKSTEARPTLGDLDFSGVKVGNKSNVVTVVNLDDNDGIRVIMDKNKKTANTIKKLQEMDRWANSNLQQIKMAVTDSKGKKSTAWVAIIETPNGDYKIISLREKGNIPVDINDDFVANLGDKFSASVSKKVFKNQNMQIIPKVSETSVNIDLKDAEILGKIYSAEDVESLEKFGLDPVDLHVESNEDKVNDFLNNLSDEEFSQINSKFAAFEQSKDELAKDLLDEYHSTTWSSVDDFLNDLKNCP